VEILGVCKPCSAFGGVKSRAVGDLLVVMQCNLDFNPEAPELGCSLSNATLFLFHVKINLKIEATADQEVRFRHRRHTVLTFEETARSLHCASRKDFQAVIRLGATYLLKSFKSHTKRNHNGQYQASLYEIL
jgi:hypothetical protein